MDSPSLVLTRVRFGAALALSLAVVMASSAQTFPGLQGFSKPNPEPKFPPQFDTFVPPTDSSVPAASAPVIAEWTRTAGPDDTLVLTGKGFSGDSGETKFLCFGQTTGMNKVTGLAVIRALDNLTAAVTLDVGLPPSSLYLLWPSNASGLGPPIAVNQTETWWLGPKNCPRGEAIAVYGRNLSHGNGTNSSWVYIKAAGAAGQWADIVSVNPYRVAFLVPVDLTNGNYEIWVHNGHGGEYGWSGPLVLTVGDSAAWSPFEFNVKNYGAQGDGIADDEAAIQAALDAAGHSPYSTLYFPAGTYMVSRGFYIYPNSRWRGDGKDLTLLKINSDYVTPASYDPRRYSLIFGYAVNFDLRDMTLDANQNLSGYSEKLISLGGSGHRYTNLRVKANGNSAAHPNGFIPFDFNNNSQIFLTGCDIIGRSSFLGNATQVFIEGCNYYGSDDANSLWEEWGGAEISLVGCTAQDYDNTRADGWAQGRFFIGNGIWGSSRNLYLGDNVSHDLTVRPEHGNQNTGEQFMWEGNSTLYRGTPISASATTVTFSNLTTNSLALSSILQEAVVVKGAGLGQHRRVVGFDNDTHTITVSPAWNLPPDLTSSVILEFAVVRCAIYRNFLDGKDRAVTNVQHIASTGVEPFGGCYDFVVDNNIFNQVREGIASWGLAQDGTPQEIQPSYFHLYANNRFQNGRTGARASVSFFDSAGTDPGYAYLGNVFRHNNVTNEVLQGFLLFGFWNSLSKPVDLTVLEHNSGSDMKVGIDYFSYANLQTNTVLYKNDLQVTPLFAVPDGQVIDELQTLIATNRQTYSDLPDNPLSFSLVEAPTGLSLNPINGVVTWKPSEAQGPSTNVVTIGAVAQGMPSLTTTQSFTVMVNEVNAPPQFGRVPTIINASFEVDSFTLGTGDVGQNGPITGWSSGPAAGLNPGPFGSPFADNGLIPDGTNVAFIHENGALAQSIAGFDIGSDYRLAYSENARNCCGSKPELTVTIGTNTIVAKHIVSPVGPYTSYHRVTSATFAALSTNLLLAFAKSDAMNGDSAVLIDDISITKIASDVSLGDYSATQGTQLSLVLSGYDSDVPAQPLTFSLVGAVPAGAVVESVSGLFTWTPSLAQSPTTNVFTTVVTDNGGPPLSATNSFTVVVSGPFDGINLADGTQAQADLDGDGLSNLAEYGLGTDPRNPLDGLNAVVGSIKTDAGGEHLAIEFKRRRQNGGISIQYVPEVSGDGQNWYADNAHVVEVIVSALGPNFDWVLVRDLAAISASAPRLIRLRFVEN
jgi:hypothetical protein